MKENMIHFNSYFFKRQDCYFLPFLCCKKYMFCKYHNILFTIIKVNFSLKEVLEFPFLIHLYCFILKFKNLLITVLDKTVITDYT